MARFTFENILDLRRSLTTVALLAAWGVVAVFFNPLHEMLRGAEGIFQGLIVFAGGLLLGPWRGTLLGVFVSGTSAFLWGRFYPTTPSATILAAVISAGSAWLCGMVGDFFRRARGQAKELRIANEALQMAEGRLQQTEKLAFLGELAASVSHELNQPLTIINMGAELALLKLPENAGAGLTELLHQIIAQGQRADRIIKHMKMLGRGESETPLEPHFLNVVLGNVVGLVGEQLRLSDVELSLQLAPEPSAVLCDPVQLEMAFTNLVMNARDAMEGRQAKRIVLSTHQANGNIVAEVRDSGPGIDPQLLSTIFQPFFTTKEIGKGTGLGLSISLRIVEAHAGQLTARNEEGQGAVFSVSLPTVGAGTPQPDAPPPAS